MSKMETKRVRRVHTREFKAETIALRLHRGGQEIVKEASAHVADGDLVALETDLEALLPSLETLSQAPDGK